MEKINVSQKYNLPKEVKFCKKCVISNQRPRIVFDKEEFVVRVDILNIKKQSISIKEKKS